VYDVRQLLADRLAVTVDHVCEARALSGPKRHTVAADSKFLRVWLGTVETMEEVADWWEEFADTMIQAHALAPWRPVARRVGSIPCPECGEVNLMIFGGESDITCGSCRMMIPEEQFGLWERIVKAEHGIDVH
jgi:hypothetical protein